MPFLYHLEELLGRGLRPRKPGENQKRGEINLLSPESVRGIEAVLDSHFYYNEA